MDDIIHKRDDQKLGILMYKMEGEGKKNSKRITPNVVANQRSNQH